MAGEVLRVGILGTGETVQNHYLPALLEGAKPRYSVVAIYGANAAVAETCRATHNIRIATTNTEEIILDPNIDLVINALPSEYHERYIIAALEAGKHVLVETPITLSLQSARRIIEAENQAANNARVFVGCARRYAPVFEETFKREVNSLERIYYARCRDISGSVSHQVGKTNGTNGVSVNGSGEMGENVNPCSGLLEEIFVDQDLTRERIRLCQFLASTGSHDFSVMREALGIPDSVSCVSVNDPFYSAIFHYRNRDATGEDRPYTLLYEAGNDGVPRTDAHLTVYGERKTISIQFGTADADIGEQPVRVIVEKSDSEGRLTVAESVSPWEDAYREEMRALYEFVVDGKLGKTSAKDAVIELRLFRMMFQQYDRQCGTIRTPLG